MTYTRKKLFDTNKSEFVSYEQENYIVFYDDLAQEMAHLYFKKNGNSLVYLQTQNTVHIGEDRSSIISFLAETTYSTFVRENLTQTKLEIVNPSMNPELAKAVIESMEHVRQYKLEASDQIPVAAAISQDAVPAKILALMQKGCVYLPQENKLIGQKNRHVPG